MTDVIEAMDAAYDLALWGPKKGGSCESGRRAMRAALSAALERGWKLVPVEPEYPMIAAAVGLDETSRLSDMARLIWEAMIQSSPEVK